MTTPNTLTHQRDTDRLVTEYLDDESLLNLCRAAPKLVIFQYDTFWKDRFLKKYGQIEKSPNKSWKTLYLQLIYYIDRGENWEDNLDLSSQGGILDELDFVYNGGADPLNFGMCSAAQGGHRDLVDWFINQGGKDHIFVWTSGIYSAAVGGHRELIDYFISLNGENHLECLGFGMRGAALGGHRDLIDYFIVLGGKDYKSDQRSDHGRFIKPVYKIVPPFAIKNYDWESAMYYAAFGGHSDLVDFFISKGSNDWNSGMLWATRGGHQDLVEFFIGKGADCLNEGVECAVRCGYLDLVYLFIAKGFDNWNFGLQYAAEKGDRDLVELFIAKGGKDYPYDWNMGMYGAALGGHTDLVDYFINLGADNWDRGVYGALQCKNRDLVDFFIAKGGREIYWGQDWENWEGVF